MSKGFTWLEEVPIEQLKVLFVALHQLNGSSSTLKRVVIGDNVILLDQMTEESKKKLNTEVDK